MVASIISPAFSTIWDYNIPQYVKWVNPNYSYKLQESIPIKLKKQYLVKNKGFLKFEESKKSCEMLSCSALNLKMLNQCTPCSFMRIFNTVPFGTQQNFLVNNPG